MHAPGGLAGPGNNCNLAISIHHNSSLLRLEDIPVYKIVYSRFLDGLRTAGMCLKILVGERGFEPPTHWSRTRCSTRLSHSPTDRPVRWAAQERSQIITSRRELPLSAGHLQLARWSSLKEESRFRLTAHISHGAPACPPWIKTLVGYGKSFPKVLYISKQLTGDAALIHLFGTSIFNR